MDVDMTGNRVKSQKVAKKPSKRLSQSKAAKAERAASRAEIAKTTAIKSAGTGVKRTEYKRGTTTKRTTAMRRRLLTLWAAFAYSVFGGVPVMMTLKYGGSTKKWMSVVPNNETRALHMHLLQEWFLEDFGYEIVFFWFLDFSTHGTSPHMHVLTCVPQDLPEGYATWDEWLELNWRVATQQEYDFDGYVAPTSPVTWVPSVDDLDPKETIEDAVKNFAWYEANKTDELTGEAVKKVASKRVSPEWLNTGNYRVRFGGVSRSLARKGQKPTGVRTKFFCLCGIADFNSMMQEHSVAKRDVREFVSRDDAAELVRLDVARWSLDFLNRGSTEFIRVTPELVEALRAIEETHAGCGTVAPVAVEDAPASPVATPEVSTPAETITASSEITKESTMEEINKALEGMFPAAEAEAMEKAAKEAFIMSFPAISIAKHHVELAAIIADPMVSDANKEEATTETARLIDRALDNLVTPDVADDVVREARIIARAEVLAPRLAKLVAHAATVDPEDRKAFADLPLLGQVESLLTPVTPVEIPRMAADPHARMPRFVAGLTSRTDADLAYLAALVRIQKSVDAMMDDSITPDDHAAKYAREVALIDELLDSGEMTPLPVEWLADRRAGALQFDLKRSKCRGLLLVRDRRGQPPMWHIGADSDQGVFVKPIRNTLISFQNRCPLSPGGRASGLDPIT